VAARTNGSGWSPMGSDSMHTVRTRCRMFSSNLERTLKFEQALSKTMTAKEAQNLQPCFAKSSLAYNCNICQDGKIIRDSPDEMEASG
jgi:hypothetical protein